jgi:AraC-like DNA-binding protein
MTHIPSAGEHKLTFAIHPDVLPRLDALAAHAGVGRSHLLRLFIALGDSMMTVDAIERARHAGADLDEDALRAREGAQETIEAVMSALGPKPIFSGSLN